MPQVRKEPQNPAIPTLARNVREIMAHVYRRPCMQCRISSSLMQTNERQGNIERTNARDQVCSLGPHLSKLLGLLGVCQVSVHQLHIRCAVLLTHLRHLYSKTLLLSLESNFLKSAPQHLVRLGPFNSPDEKSHWSRRLDREQPTQQGPLARSLQPVVLCIARGGSTCPLPLEEICTPKVFPSERLRQKGIPFAASKHLQVPVPAGGILSSNPKVLAQGECMLQHYHLF